MSAMPRLLEGWTVLVADDEPDSLDVAKRLLLKAGAHVLTATDGAEALAVIQQQRPDCVLSDISMPEMDGWLLIEALNQHRPTAAIPVIALTAHAMPGDRERAIRAGFIHYITKPLDPRKFVEQIVAILSAIPDLASRFSPPPAPAANPVQEHPVRMMTDERKTDPDR